MNSVRWLFRRLSPPAVAAAAAGAALAWLLVSSPGRSTESSGSVVVLPGNPVAGRAVVMTVGGSELVGTGYRWEFGDGEVSEVPAPLHVFRDPGEYPVRLTVETPSGPVVVSKTVSVSAATTLRLLGGRFDVTLLARDQRTGNTGDGLALPENDLFGYFAIPALTNNPDNPEMFVKILDGRVINGQFWVFYNGLTDLDVTLTVRENPTGIVKTYRKEPGSACGGFDTSGFTPPAGTQTVTINVRAWDFSPGGPDSPPLRLQVGVTYRLVFHNADSVGTPNPRHGFSGISDLGLPGTDDIALGGPDFVVPSFTPQAFQRGTHPFGCTQNECGGDPEQHVRMVGNLLIE
jgi:PKD repeat protein